MRLTLHIALSAQPKPGHNEVHPILVSIGDQSPFLSRITPRDLGSLRSAGFSGAEIDNAMKELIEKGTTILQDVDVDESYVWRFFADAA
jgi:hypothetical protein